MDNATLDRRMWKDFPGRLEQALLAVADHEPGVRPAAAKAEEERPPGLVALARGELPADRFRRSGVAGEQRHRLVLHDRHRVDNEDACSDSAAGPRRGFPERGEPAVRGSCGHTCLPCRVGHGLLAAHPVQKQALPMSGGHIVPDSRAGLGTGSAFPALLSGLGLTPSLHGFAALVAPLFASIYGHMTINVPETR